MTTQQFFKGLFMVIIPLLVSAFTTTPVDWVMLGISTICTVLVYSGKNLILVLHSNSPAGSMSFINILSGILIALGTGLLDGVAMYLIDGVIVWAMLWKYVVYVSLTYLTATFFAPPYSAEKKRGLVA